MPRSSLGPPSGSGPAMGECGQDAIWHAEGDVWTHTCLVWRAGLEQLPFWRNSRVRTNSCCCSPVCSTIRASRPRRDRRSADWPHALAVPCGPPARRLPGACCRQLSLAHREAVCSMVMCHGRPPYAFEKERPEFEVVRPPPGSSAITCSMGWLADAGRDGDYAAGESASLEAAGGGTRLLRQPCFANNLSDSLSGRARQSPLRPARRISLHDDHHVGLARLGEDLACNMPPASRSCRSMRFATISTSTPPTIKVRLCSRPGSVAANAFAAASTSP